MIDWWGPVLVEYWGGSESGVVTLVDSETWLAHPGTVGRAIGSWEVFAADDDGQPLPAGHVGMLYCRNPSLGTVFEYHQAPEKTSAARLDAETFTLGDIGRVDDDGYVYLSDRAAHTIISGGVNIYPAEIEAILQEHPAIADLAVFGVPDEEWGEQVKAAVCLHDGYDWSDDAPGRAATPSPGNAWPASRCRARGTSTTSSRGTRPASCTSAGSAPPTGPNSVPQLGSGPTGGGVEGSSPWQIPHRSPATHRRPSTSWPSWGSGTGRLRGSRAWSAIAGRRIPTAAGGSS